jgi:hypothetical protein
LEERAFSDFFARLTNEVARAALRAQLSNRFPVASFLPINLVIGRATNGPAVYEKVRLAYTNYNSNPLFLELERRGYVSTPLYSLTYYTNLSFTEYLPASLNNCLWTNFIGHTNGRSTRIWSVRSHPTGWPSTPPQVVWNTNCLIWGMRGATAICPCWEGEESPGTKPLTALTRRHVYTRGHGMGPEGFFRNYAGKRVWFCGSDNRIFETRVLREVVRTRETSKRDYTILILKDDLPGFVQPLRVVADATRVAKYPLCDKAPYPLFMPEQTGNVSAGVPGLSVATWKGGDSGSPNFVPMPGELVFYGGRSTMGPAPEMQADMDELSRMEHLQPSAYQMQWVDLSSFPSY